MGWEEEAPECKICDEMSKCMYSTITIQKAINPPEPSEEPAPELYKPIVVDDHKDDQGRIKTMNLMFDILCRNQTSPGRCLEIQWKKVGWW